MLKTKRSKQKKIKRRLKFMINNKFNSEGQKYRKESVISKPKPIRHSLADLIKQINEMSNNAKVDSLESPIPPIPPTTPIAA